MKLVSNSNLIEGGNLILKMLVLRAQGWNVHEGFITLPWGDLDYRNDHIFKQILFWIFDFTITYLHRQFWNFFSCSNTTILGRVLHRQSTVILIWIIIMNNCCFTPNHKPVLTLSIQIIWIVRKVSWSSFRIESSKKYNATPTEWREGHLRFICLRVI